MLTADRYGFHRDELQFFDDARFLAWGYVTYPPFAPFIARVSRELFGESLAGLRFFSALAQGAAVVMAGLTARELGGGRLAQIITALSVAIAPLTVVMSTMFAYVSFDFLWWVAIAWCAARLLRTENPRWWLGIGALIGLGMLTKYTMPFYVAGIVGGVVLTRSRRYLASPWLWAGVALSLLIFLPNLIWQIQHDFVSLDFLGSIHARDVREGRTEGFLFQQLLLAANPFTIPLWAAGLIFLFFTEGGRKFRMLGWMAVIPVALFMAAQGLGYYTAGVYPMLIAAGACVGEGWLRTLSTGRARLARAAAGGLLALGGVGVALVGMPLGPVNSALWDIASSVNGDMKEQIGWPELVDTVADIYAALPADERARTGIVAGNYGEAGAINLYGPPLGLPEAISGINSYWLRGYGDPPPQTVIVVGFTAGGAHQFFTDCRLAGHNTNRYGVRNEESVDHPDIFVCGAPRLPWPEFWARFQYFG